MQFEKFEERRKKTLSWSYSLNLVIMLSFSQSISGPWAREPFYLWFMYVRTYFQLQFTLGSNVSTNCKLKNPHRRGVLGPADLKEVVKFSQNV